MYLNYNYVYKVFYRILIFLFEGYWFMILQFVFLLFKKKSNINYIYKINVFVLLFSIVIFKYVNNKL